MFELQKITTSNLIEITGVLLTICAIVISIWQFGKSVNHSIIEGRQQMALEKTSELPLQVSEFCANASNVAAGIFVGQDNLTSEQKLEYDNSKKREDELLPIIKNSIMAYGSNDAIKIFTHFESYINNPKVQQISVEAYYIIPLLLAQVKMDVTGEVINPLIFLNSLMPQFKEHNDKAKEYINIIIRNLNLSNKLIIND